MSNVHFLLSFTVENAESILSVLCSERQKEGGRTGYRFSVITVLHDVAYAFHTINSDADFSCRNENLPARILWSKATKIESERRDTVEHNIA